MGDVRFEQALARVRQADDRASVVRGMRVEDIVCALGALGREADGILANVLATELLNRARRALVILEHVAEGVVGLDGEGRVTFANPAACRLLGWARADVLGLRFHDLVRHRKAGEPERPDHDCPLRRVLREGAQAVREDDGDVFVRRDGTEFFAAFSAAPVVTEGTVTGAALAFSDVTRQKEDEARLRLFEAALDAVPDPILWVDRDGRIAYANRTAARHAGRPRERLVGLTVFDLDADATPVAWSAHWARVKRMGSAHVEGHHRARDGRLVPVELEVSHVERGPEEFQVMVIHPKGPLP